jgi:NhaP-type Na+/H+ or K+/H+ antiporter
VVRLPRGISAGARRRRAFLADTLVALALALVAILIAAGIGVVGFVALSVFLVTGSWIAMECLIKSITRRVPWRAGAGPATRG